MIVFCLLLLVAAGIYICGDFLDVDMSIWADDQHSSVVVQMVMILLTLGLVPLALRLFKFGKIAQALKKSPEQSLLKWGLIRLLVLGVLLIVNTLLYYMYAEMAFGYLAIVVLLTMPFVVPTIKRCQTETGE